MPNRINLGFPKGRYINLPILDTKGKSITDFFEEHLAPDEVDESSVDYAVSVEDSNQAEIIDKRLIEIDLKIKLLSEKIMKLECISQALLEDEDD
ncbi:MAG: hypothetical protein Q8T08_12965 [Ignavibacteria bacterium]|nr:hypothetical protein [Ignavibacteria bacterium]